MTTETVGKIGMTLGLATWIPGALVTFVILETADRIQGRPSPKSSTAMCAVLALAYPVLVERAFEDLLGDEV